jgi:hypothetical protein
MSNEILQLAFREKRTVRNELFLVDELDEVQLFEYQQKLKQSQLGIEIAPVLRETWIKKRAIRSRNYYRKTPLLKEKKRLSAQKFRIQNPERAKECSRNWRNKNKDAVNAKAREKYTQWRKTLSDEEFKAFNREKNRKSREKRFAKFGIEKAREMERERRRKSYAAKKLNQQGDK